VKCTFALVKQQHKHLAPDPDIPYDRLISI
jgi:hypothetical protein